jgi:hypothetical protein
MSKFKYLKFNVDDLKQSMVFFEYLADEGDEPTKLVDRAIPLTKLLEVETKLAEFLEGDVVGVYLEQSANMNVVEKHWVDRVENELTEENLAYFVELTKRACVDKEFDELLKPPSIDEQVEDFIKEFFTDEDSEDIEQKDFLEEFFSDLESEADDQPLKTKKGSNRSLTNEFDKEFNNKSATARDFLSEFFAEIEEKD